MGFPGGSHGKESTCNAGGMGLIPGSGRSLGEENGYRLQYSCLENSMEGRAWWATVHRVAKSRTWLSDLSTDVVVDVEIEANLDHTWRAPPRAGAHGELVT